jgi:hypothetical protein
MKKRNVYRWIFLVSGVVWAAGCIGIISGMFLYPESNLLGGLGIVFGLVVLLGSSIFQLTLVVWLIHRISKWLAQKCCRSEIGASEKDAK